MIEHNFISEKGKFRAENEDSYCVFNMPNLNCFIVSDGIGGLQNGILASSLTCSTIQQYIEMHSFSDPNTLLIDSIKYANDILYNYPSKSEVHVKMGATVSIALIAKNKLYVANSGDSKIYLLRGKKVRQLTDDHTAVNLLLTKNIITKEEALNHSRKNELTQAIGISNTIYPFVHKPVIRIKPNDKILLCTDGLSGYISNNSILSIISTKNVNVAVQSLIAAAEEAGSRDNITVGVIQILNPISVSFFKPTIILLVIFSIFLTILYFLM